MDTIERNLNINRMLEKLRTILYTCETQRVGQLLCNVLKIDERNKAGKDLFYRTDEEVETLLDKYLNKDYGSELAEDN